MTHNCIKCGDLLILGENITQYNLDNSQYTCQICRQEYDIIHRDHKRNVLREWNHRTGRNHPMNENRKCSSFLGVHIAESVLSRVFKNVQKMPYGNKGFDFVCSNGYKIDVKSSCSLHRPDGRMTHWHFTIKHNRVADYFLMLAFNNRDDLDPMHIWLIPGSTINNKISVSITENSIDKWNEYELDINRVSICCDAMRK